MIMQVSLIAAMSENMVIGRQGRLPWHLPNDLKHFKSITMGRNILMGRRTFDSIAKALPGRRNFVLTRDRAFHAKDVRVLHSFDEAMDLKIDQLMVIGGAEIYRMFIPVCQAIHMTLVHAEIGGDTYFPPIDGFIETTRKFNDCDSKHRYSYSFIEYRPTMGVAPIRTTNDLVKEL